MINASQKNLNELTVKGERGVFLTLLKKLKEKKPQCFGLLPKTQGQFFLKPQACGIFKHMIFFCHLSNTVSFVPNQRLAYVSWQTFSLFQIELNPN